jgi:diacylglycerol O-acyltransferase
MSRYAYERLSGQDNDFLLWERPNLPMHVGGTEIFDPGELALENGGIDFDAIKNLMRSLLHRIPRYRQKIAWTADERHAIWVDDDHFSLDYHIRHTSLPRPGTEAQMKRLVARIMEHPLDRARPLWETWVVEGLEGGRFAVVNKLHHCMVDGASGVELSQILLSPTPARVIEEARPFYPHPAPTRSELRADDLSRSLLTPLRMAADLFEFVRSTSDLSGEVLRRVEALGELVRWKLFPASETPINGAVGPHRDVDWFSTSLDETKKVARAAGCTVNDVVLAVVSGGFRRYMKRRQVNTDKLDFRVSAPVNTRPTDEEGKLGNHVSSWIIRLPVHESDPLKCIKKIHEITNELKRSNQSVGIEMVMSVHDWLPIDMQAASVGTVNSVVTNVPGPQLPLYMLGAELLQIYAHPPLIDNIGLAIGVVSYNGVLGWCFQADHDRVPDLAEFKRGVRSSFRDLAAAAGVVLDLEPATSADTVRA